MSRLLAPLAGAGFLALLVADLVLPIFARITGTL